MPADADRHRAIAVLGGPGAGKGTLAERLQVECGLQHVDLGHVLRVRAALGDPVGGRIDRIQARGEMVPKDVVLQVLREHLASRSSDRPIVLDGFPRTTAQLAAAQDGRVPITIERAIWLDVPRTVAEMRLRTRADRAPRNDDGDMAADRRFALMGDTVEAVRQELSARGMLEIVDASRSADDVFEVVRMLLDPLLTCA